MWLIHIYVTYRLDKNDDQLLKELMDIHHSITRLKYVFIQILHQ